MLYNFPGYPFYLDVTQAALIHLAFTEIGIFPTSLHFFGYSLTHLEKKAHSLPFRHPNLKPEGQIRSFILKKKKKKEQEGGQRAERERQRKRMKERKHFQRKDKNLRREF